MEALTSRGDKKAIRLPQFRYDLNLRTLNFEAGRPKKNEPKINYSISL